jgi:ABC-type multidrug transport system ATPase subunit
MEFNAPEQPLIDLVFKWLNGSLSKPMLLIGEEDSGKTTFVQTLVSKGTSLHAPGNIYLNLHNLTGLHHRLPSREEMITECLLRCYFDEFTYKDYCEHVKADALVIVDGIEKALAQLTPYDGEVLVREVLRFVRPLTGPLLITCRPETLAAFPSLGETYKVYMPRLASDITATKAA